MTPNDDRNFVFVGEHQSICHTKKCLEMSSAFLMSGKLEEMTCPHIQAEPCMPQYFTNFTDKEIENFSPDINLQALM